MGLAELTSPDTVVRVLREFDELGRERFLSKYGFRTARSYFVLRDGRVYDSKAIAGAAHAYQHPQLGALRPADFSGVTPRFRTRLESLGFRDRRGTRRNEVL